MSIQVLMIDDEKKICGVVKKGLELVGDFKVEIASSGKEGLHLAKCLKPDVILLDIRMPDMDGLAVLKALKSNYPSLDIPVIMLSALVDDATKQTCAREYGEEYVEKPVVIQELKNRIESILRRLGRLAP